MSNSADLYRLSEEELQNVFAPERVTRLIQSLAPELKQEGRTALHIMPLAWRIGHLAMEPHAFWELFGDDHDRLVLLTPDASFAPPSRGLRPILQNVAHLKETADGDILLMGQMDAGILNIGPLTWYQRGPIGLLDDYIRLLNEAGRQPRHFSVPETVSAEAQAFCEKRGISSSDQIVVLNVRDHNFLPDQTTHFYRAADIATYESSVRYLLDKGYWVLRTGVSGSVDAPFAHPRYLDIWKEQDYTDLLDPGLIARARFGITCSSGPEAIFRILGVPQLMVNGVLQSGMWMNPKDKLVFKTYYTINDGRPAKLNALLMQGATLFSDRENIAKCGFAVEDNTAEEILQAVIEMDASLANEHHPDKTANQRFLKIGSDYQAFLSSTGHPTDPRSITRRQTQFGYALPWTQLADSYVTSHPEFLE